MSEDEEEDGPLLDSEEVDETEDRERLRWELMDADDRAGRDADGHCR